ncbi:MAG: NPCBM/NEW2 domain-containing protein [Lacipirellulaceae bacterium]
MNRCIQSCLVVALGVVAWSPAVAGGSMAGSVVLVGGVREEAKLVAFAYSSAQHDEATGTFARPNGERFEAGPADLVRYGRLVDDKGAPVLVLADGSRLVASRGWAPGGIARADAEMVSVQRNGGWASAPRKAAALLLLDPSAVVLADLTSAGDDELAADVDRVWLADGDFVEGRLVAIDAEGVRVEVAGAEVTTPLDRAVAVQFASDREAAATTPYCLVGLDDGTLLRAVRVEIDGETLGATTAGGAALSTPVDRVTLVQPVGDASSRVVYLSDLEPADYRHTPYVAVAWPYARDAGLPRPEAPQPVGLATGAGRQAKGLSMHSASRVVYALDGGPRTLRASLAVARASESSASGSVVLRVYGARDGRFEPLHESDVVRGGDAPRDVEVDLSGATAVALVVDYADRGDEADEAQWLDARLERPEP